MNEGPIIVRMKCGLLICPFHPSPTRKFTVVTYECFVEYATWKIIALQEPMLDFSASRRDAGGGSLSARVS
jgi:hypothetical protein